MKKIIVKNYKTESIYQKDAERMIKKGYEVINVTSKQPRRGWFFLIFALLTFGLLLLLFKPKPVLVVTYRLQK